MSGVNVSEAMLFAAGFGKRMRHLSATTPKPLIPLSGKPLISYGLDKLAAAGVGHVVVNVHYLAGQVVDYLATRPPVPRITISDESDAILETGGGLRRALPHFSTPYVMVMNSDTAWDEEESNLLRLARLFDPARMDMLLLLADNRTSLGDVGRGDFFLDADARLRRRGEAAEAPFTYAGAMIMRLSLIEPFGEEPFSLNRLFDGAMAEGRLFGTRLEGTWMHVGTPEALEAVEAARKASAGA